MTSMRSGTFSPLPSSFLQSIDVELLVSRICHRRFGGIIMSAPVRIRSVLSLVVLIAFAAGLLMPLAARADGVIIVDPPPCDPACPKPIYVGDQLIVKSHRVEVTIADQVATTSIDQVFNNP